jgi:hypothetical protein
MHGFSIRCVDYPDVEVGSMDNVNGVAVECIDWVARIARFSDERFEHYRFVDFRRRYRDAMVAPFLQYVAQLEDCEKELAAGGI